jgi:hypothetical protein
MTVNIKIITDNGTKMEKKELVKRYDFSITHVDKLDILNILLLS